MVRDAPFSRFHPTTQLLLTPCCHWSTRIAALTLRRRSRYPQLPQLPQPLSTPPRPPPHLTDDRLLEKMARDKKFDQGAIRFILVPKPDDAHVGKTITMTDIADAINFLRQEPDC